MKTDGNLPTQLTNKSTETQNQNHGQGIKPEKLESMDPKISGKHVTRNERSDNGQSENSRKNSDHTPRLPSSGNDGQSPNHETLLTLMVTQSNGNGNYILAGKLMDLTTGRPLQGMKVFFTADSPIKINNQITNREGIFMYECINCTRNRRNFQNSSTF